jgi:protein TonB
MTPRPPHHLVLASLASVCCTVASANEALTLPSGHVCRPLAYPPAAIKSRAEGTTVILYEVRADGSIPKALIQASAGTTREHKLLDRIAVTMLNATCSLPPEATVTVGAFRYEHVSRLPREVPSSVSAPEPAQ